MTIAQNKEALRAEARATRDAIDPVRRLELSERIHDVLDGVGEFTAAASLGLYWAGGSEVNMTALTLRVGEIEQRRIFLPFVLNGELCLTEWRPQDPVVDADYGNMHPRYRRAVTLDQVDVLLVPGLAFDRAGRRLGSGTGHYDRLLARLDPRTTRIGVAFADQIRDEIPVEDFDQNVDVLVTEEGAIVCSADRSIAR